MTRTSPAPSGIEGLDSILAGGFPRSHIYLVEGDPGVGKTTLAIQFLIAGREAGERTLYVTLSETARDIEAVSASHGWSLDGIELFELSALEQQMRLDAETTVFHPSEVQLDAITRTLLDRIEQVVPSRVVFDSLSELRLLAQSALRYRREVLTLKQYFAGKQCTVLLLDDRTAEVTDLQVHSLAHGVVSLEQHAPVIGSDRRRIRVRKLRGVDFRTGYHDYKIVTGGLQVYPRLVAAEHQSAFVPSVLSSGLAELDALLGGGLHRGTNLLILGPAGTGKSSLAAQYATAAAARGDRALILGFDEIRGLLIARADALGFDMSRHVEARQIEIRQIDPAEMGPGELIALIRARVAAGVRMVVVDSVNGMLNSMPEDRHLYMQLHELLSYLAASGVTTILIMAQNGMFGAQMSAPVDISYIADTVLLLRHFESSGRIRKAISVVKKRSGLHEDTIRELSLSDAGLTVGEPLSEFHGVLTGVPTFVGDEAKLRP
ncbi:MAG TPA: ATPase domain-containing protein [Kofleriaceae bacterium]